jgi:hypothetical protein
MINGASRDANPATEFCEQCGMRFGNGTLRSGEVRATMEG